MQPTSNQVAKSLAALSQGAGDRDETTGPRPQHAERSVDDVLRSLPAGLLEELEQTIIDVRTDRLDRARARLESGQMLSADELADRIVGRLVCDRLR